MNLLPTLLVALILFAGTAPAQKLFVNSATGRDSAAGTQEQPLQSLPEAARRVNQAAGAPATEIILAEGLYVLTETALFQRPRPYSASARLTIRAEFLPDDPAWHPQRMPTIVTAVPLLKDTAGETGNGLQIEVSHATIQGLRFTGGLHYFYQGDRQFRRSYPIWRDGKTLDDLIVSQCVFIGDDHVMPLQVGVIANGHGLVVDHCVFYHVRNPVVFWRAEGGISHRNAMTNSLVYGASVSGVWTVETDGADFVFRNNVIANSATIWMRERGSSRAYQAVNCLFAGNENVAAYGGGAAGPVTLTGSAFLTLQDMRPAGKITLQMDQGARDYLHILKGTVGSSLHAGLFTKE
ncbi:MAG: hypothetical protein K2X03_22820 [Bryobacteraceae bacterium]|nr:hypothetical protein [Bryobacteraceae bacterium]